MTRTDDLIREANLSRDDEEMVRLSINEMVNAGADRPSDAARAILREFRVDPAVFRTHFLSASHRRRS